MQRLRTKLFLAGVVVLMAVPSQSALISRAGGTMYYDDVLDITWLQNANFCATNPTDPSCLAVTQTGGSMTWDNAVAWADALVFGGFDDWRLPSISVAAGLPHGPTATPVFCTGANELDCRDNEFGYMFYHNGVTLAAPSPFQNVGPVYWTATEFDSFNAWGFGFVNGEQAAGLKGLDVAAWAVRSGDVLAATPEPGTWLLLGAGALGLVRARKRTRPTA